MGYLHNAFSLWVRLKIVALLQTDTIFESL